MMHDSVRLEDLNRCPIAQWLVLEDGAYFGGCSADVYANVVKGVFGPHMWLLLNQLLAALADAASQTTPAGSFYLSSSNGFMALTPDLDAAELARILHCDTAAVVDYYGRLVRVTDDCSA